MKIKNYLLSTMAILGLLTVGQAQVSFTNTTSLLGGNGIFSYENCVVDMNGDYLDDVVRVSSGEIYVDYQNEDGSFTHQVYPTSLQNLPSWSICAGDLDENGRNDLLIGDGDALSFVLQDDNGTTFTEYPGTAYIFSQRTTMADIDNDGDLDAFTCHDIDLSHPYRNDGTGMMTLDQTLIETIDQPGNYAAIWTDYDNDGDIDLYVTKCRGGAQPGDPTRTNRMYRNNGDGTYSEVGEDINMDDNAQSWATVFEDFDNDGDFDAFIVNHDFENRFMINDGSGNFTDIIDQTGINPNDLGAWENASGDFDNNGYVDIFSELNNELYLNNGDLTFTGVNLSFDEGGIGDLNDDGFLDVVNGNTAWINDGNENNWVKINTRGIISNMNGIGARVEIHGAWGTQIREVRSGQSFSPMSSLTVHFGLGTADAIEKIVIKWPSGIITSVDNPAINTTHNLVEAECLLDQVDLTVNGSTEICEGESVTISAPAGFEYEWSNGANSQSIEVSEAGSYRATLYSLTDSCVALTNTVQISIIEEQFPVIVYEGDVEFCEGTSVILTAANGINYVWSDGTVGETLEVSTGGEYFVSADATCSGGQVDSEPIVLTSLAAPAPEIESIIENGNGTFTLTGIGDSLHWYDAATGGNLVWQGNVFETPDLMGAITSYFVEAIHLYGGENQTGGKPDNSGGGGIPGTGAYSFFDAWEPFTIKQVTVYVTAGMSGMRTIQLADADGNILEEMTVSLEEGEQVIDLDFEVPVGEDLSLRCAENNLFRNNSGVNYPYAIGDVGELTTSFYGGSYYYYFYDWQIQKEFWECISERVEVGVITDTDELDEYVKLEVFPNPTSGLIFVDFEALETVNLELKVFNVLGQMVWTKALETNHGTEQIDLSKFAKGSYHLEVRAADAMKTFRIIVQ